MSHTPHELAAEFPEHSDRIHALKGADAHFAKRLDEYHEVNRAIHRAETDIEPTDDDHLEAMKRQRLALKDELLALIKAD
ncbi:MAG TPA: DUF465 domain-containing protein [Devosiaceae bacterium]